MWASFLSSSENAKERLLNTLEKTGDIITERATSHVRLQKQQQQDQLQEEDSEKNTDTELNSKSIIPNSSSSTTTTKTSSQTPSSIINPDSHLSSSAKDKDTTVATPTSSTPSSLFSLKQSLTITSSKIQTQEEMFQSIKSGWGSVISATKQAVESTRDAMEKEQHRLFHKGPYRRDPSLPLDVEALRDTEVVYITDRLISMSHPAIQSPTNGDITPTRKLTAIAHLLHKRHSSKYMIWNLSELEYDYNLLEDQVMTFSFPGCPSPPLGLLLKIMIGMESWLNADPENVAVVHCLTGRGRTSAVLACFLCWIGEAGFGNDVNAALEYIAMCKKMEVEKLTIPSQIRYVGYFKNMLDGVRPSQPPLLLKRIIMSEAPKFGKHPNVPLEDGESNRSGQLGCSPYIQIFKAGKLVFTAAATKSYNQSKDVLPFCLASDGPITFPLETLVQGDILVRCRHLTHSGQRVSMFRAAFHTGYIPPKVMRLTKAQLDGCEDKRYSQDFFIDLIFEVCDAAMASKHLLSSPDEDEEEGQNVTSTRGDKSETLHNEAASRRMIGTMGGSDSDAAVDSEKKVMASAYDSMLHRDSRFWDVISKRQEAIAKMHTLSTADTSDNVESSKFYGPTIGRRRDFVKDADTKQGVESIASTKTVAPSRISSIESFSIGGELDFTIDNANTDLNEVESVEISNINKLTPVLKKDDLMEALMAIDDDVDIDTDANTSVEEIVFQTDDSAESGVQLHDTVERNDIGEEGNTNTLAAETDVVDEGLDIDTDTDAVEEKIMVQADNDDDDDDDDEFEDLEKFLMKATGK